MKKLLVVATVIAAISLGGCSKGSLTAAHVDTAVARIDAAMASGATPEQAITALEGTAITTDLKITGWIEPPVPDAAAVMKLERLQAVSTMVGVLNDSDRPLEIRGDTLSLGKTAKVEFERSGDNFLIERIDFD